MAAPTKAEQLEAERERYRAEGWTEDDIRQWLIQKELQKSSPAAAAANFSAPQMPMAGVLGNASAVLSHVGQTIPVVKKNFANLSDGSALRRSRATSAAILAGVAVIVAALGFAVYQEWQQHIIFENEIQKQQAAVAAQVAAGQAAQARMTEAQAKYADLLAEGQKAQAESSKQQAVSAHAQSCATQIAALRDWTPPLSPEAEAVKKYIANCPDYIDKSIDHGFFTPAPVPKHVARSKEECVTSVAHAIMFQDYDLSETQARQRVKADDPEVLQCLAEANLK